MNEPIALIGPRGAGKSSLAPLLAAALDRPLVDVDGRIEGDTGEGLRGLIERQGFAAFRQRELAALSAAIGEGSPVIACGAGMVETAAARQLLRANCRILWLDIPPAIQAARIAGCAARPRLLPDTEITEEFRLIDERRRPLYAALGGAAIDAAPPLPMVLRACIEELS